MPIIPHTARSSSILMSLSHIHSSAASPTKQLQMVNIPSPKTSFPSPQCLIQLIFGKRMSIITQLVSHRLGYHNRRPQIAEDTLFCCLSAARQYECAQMAYRNTEKAKLTDKSIKSRIRENPSGTSSAVNTSSFARGTPRSACGRRRRPRVSGARWNSK
jgi:hypothetical protein